MLFYLTQIVSFAWFCLLAIWIIGAMTTKPTRQRQSWTAVFFQLLLPVMALAFLFDHFQISFLGRQMQRPTAGDLLIGFGLALGGIAFSCWARFSLGSNWSGYISIKEGHTLVRQGPYRLVRHPIYTGLLAAGAGTAFMHGYTHCVLALGLLTLTAWIKLRMEERFMIEEFGEDYLTYRKQVRALIPFVM